MDNFWVVPLRKCTGPTFPNSDLIWDAVHIYVDLCFTLLCTYFIFSNESYSSNCWRSFSLQYSAELASILPLPSNLVHMHLFAIELQKCRTFYFVRYFIARVSPLACWHSLLDVSFFYMYLLAAKCGQFFHPQLLTSSIQLSCIFPRSVWLFRGVTGHFLRSYRVVLIWDIFRLMAIVTDDEAHDISDSGPPSDFSHTLSFKLIHCSVSNS